MIALFSLSCQVLIFKRQILKIPKSPKRHQLNLKRLLKHIFKVNKMCEFSFEENLTKIPNIESLETYTFFRYSNTRYNVSQAVFNHEISWRTPPSDKHVWRVHSGISCSSIGCSIKIVTKDCTWYLTFTVNHQDLDKIQQFRINWKWVKHLW